MLVLNASKTVLEGDLKLSDCEREFAVRWLSGSSQASFFIGDKPQEQADVALFITGNHICFIDLESYIPYLRQVKEIVGKYGSMYYGPFGELDKIISRFERMKKESAKVVLSYQNERYIRVLNNKKDYKTNKQLYGDWALENGDCFRHSFAGGITSIRIEKKDDKYILSVKLLDNWRDIIMQENGKKVDLESLVAIFNEEIKISTAKGLSADEAAKVFGIKYEPLLRNNSTKFTYVDIVQASDHNQQNVIGAVKEGMKLSPSVIWAVTESPASPINGDVGTGSFDGSIPGYNLIVYGTPGCGKSFFVENKLLASGKYKIGGIERDGLGIDDNMRVRTTFFQDYTNTDFVGQILPKQENGDVKYDFFPGPFTIALKKALDPSNKGKPVALIIEELNRGSAASIFGDIFQLLDRKTSGESTYKIVNTNVADYLNKEFKGVDGWSDVQTIGLPANLFIIATMNTSDQNVFTLDTAFKRRWRFEKLANEFTEEHDYRDYCVPGFDPNYSYEGIVKSLNEFMVNKGEQMMNEDKQIGIYFLEKDQLIKDKMTAPTTEQKRNVAFKLLEYLWDDVSRMQHDFLFRGDINTLDKLLERFEQEGEKVFSDDLQKDLSTKAPRQ